VWYSFTAASVISETIILSNLASNITNPRLQLFSGSCGTLTSLQCGTTSITATGLMLGNTYYIRVSNLNSDPSGTGTNSDFNICITHPAPPPSNDACSGATPLTIGTVNSSGTVMGATASSGIAAGCASGDADDDVWYKFSATSTSATVSLSSIGTNLSAAGAMVQLFSGTCASLTSLACGYTSLSTSGLTVGNTYYIRVYSSMTGSIGGTSTGSQFSITVTNPPAPTQTTVGSGRMKEVFQQTTLSGTDLLNDPWEITYGPDGYLWITEAKGYKVYRMDPSTGIKTMILDVSQNSYFLPAAERSFNLQFNFSGQGNPQGGFAGLAIHPDFNAAIPKKYVYVSYIHKYVTTLPGSAGAFFVNQLVRFTYNTTTGFLESPVSLCDTLPGSSDHNSQRMIIAPVNGINYLFYASGDMGSGQYSNTYRENRSQTEGSYEGKILRFNLEPDGDVGSYDQWIPNDNPFNNSSQNAVWSIGIRNNQGFAYAKINGIDYLYGSSHGPFSDDEINIIEKGKNYGHPIVIGYSSDGNYDNAKAGPNASSLPLIVSESATAASLGASYKDPIFTFYPAPKGNATTPNTIQYIYTNNPANSGWPSEAPSGMDIYTKTIVPGWKNSLIVSALKWGRIMRLKLNTAGNATTATDGKDTVGYFDSQNRFRDIAFSPDGRDIFVIMDKSPATSGPSTNNPSVVTCAGCVQRFRFLGYEHNTSTGKSNIPSTIDITSGVANTIINGTTITIDATNNNLWVPITGPDGNILAEIKANGNNLGVVTSSLYLSSPVRENASKRLYLNRSITITPQNQPSSTVNVRLYFTSGELASLVGATSSQGRSSGVSTVNDIKVLKNDDTSPDVLTAATTTVFPTYAVTHAGTSTGGYVLQADINSFSTFYFGNPTMSTLPSQLIHFKGTLQNNTTVLQWETANETNASHFGIERSNDGQNFEEIGQVKAHGNIKNNYLYIDKEAASQASPMLYYRLKIVDADNSFKHSNVISVSFKTATIVNVYPNPIEEVLNLRLSFEKADHIEILITDIQGRVVYKQNKFVVTGLSDIKINSKSWPSQPYSLQIIGSDKTILVSKKIVKM
jgi:trimeric autotransporter adhesin